MDSFSDNNVQYSDGQTNKLPIPDEIMLNGFKPPVMLPDGSIQAGDFLAANHLNFIFNDLYNKLKASLVITEQEGDNASGYRRFSNGDVELWGEATSTAAGTAAITFPITLPGVIMDICLTDLSTAFDSVFLKVDPGSRTATGFTVRVNDGSSSAVDGRKFTWRAKYHG